MNRQIQFCKWYKQRLIECLEEDMLYAELAFSLISIDLMLRQNEISMLTWEQIDHQNRLLLDVKISKKLSHGQQELQSYGNIPLPEEVYFALIDYKTACDITNGRIFNINNRGVYYDNIGKSIGDITFNGIRLRQIGITLKTAELKDGKLFE